MSWLPQDYATVMLHFNELKEVLQHLLAKYFDRYFCALPWNFIACIVNEIEKFGRQY